MNIASIFILEDGIRLRRYSVKIYSEEGYKIENEVYRILSHKYGKKIPLYLK